MCRSVILLRLCARRSVQTSQHGSFAVGNQPLHRPRMSTQAPGSEPEPFPRHKQFDRHDKVVQVSSIMVGNRKLSRETANSLTAEEKDALFQAGLGPLRPEDLKIQKRLCAPASNPTTILRQCIAAGTASTHVVRMCLETQFEEAIQLPRSKRKTLATAQSSIAPVVIDYLLQGQHLWGPFVMHCPNSQFILSYYAILCGMESRILQLMRVEMVGEKVQNMWRGSLLRNLVRAHATLDTEGNKDAAIRCFLNVLNERLTALAKHKKALIRDMNARPPPIVFVNSLPTVVLLSEALTDNGNRNTNPKLFENLLQAIESPDSYFAERSQTEVDYDVAYLLLYYPSFPKDTAALKLLRTFAEGNVNAFPERITTPKGEKYFKRFLQRTVDVLEANDNPTESYWVKQKYSVLLDPKTGNFATPTRIHRPGSAVGQTKRASWESSESAEPVPFPTFT